MGPGERAWEWAADLMSKLCQAVVFLLLAWPAVAQSQTFEAASLKPARSGDPSNMRVRVLPNGDLKASAVPVLLLMSPKRTLKPFGSMG